MFCAHHSAKLRWGPAETPLGARCRFQHRAQGLNVFFLTIALYPGQAGRIAIALSYLFGGAHVFLLEKREKLATTTCFYSSLSPFCAPTAQTISLHGTHGSTHILPGVESVAKAIPTKLMPSTTTKMARPGGTHIHGIFARICKGRALFSMFPRKGPGAERPGPKSSIPPPRGWRKPRLRWPRPKGAKRRWAGYGGT